MNAPSVGDGRPNADGPLRTTPICVRFITTPTGGLPSESRRNPLIATEGVTIDFTDDGIRAVAKIAAEVNAAVENIGARRLQTVMEKLIEEVSFDAEDRSGTSLTIDAAYVDRQLASIARNTDLSRFVL